MPEVAPKLWKLPFFLTSHKISLVSALGQMSRSTHVLACVLTPSPPPFAFTMTKLPCNDYSAIKKSSPAPDSWRLCTSLDMLEHNTNTTGLDKMTHWVLFHQIIISPSFHYNSWGMHEYTWIQHTCYFVSSLFWHLQDMDKIIDDKIIVIW